MLFTEKIKRYCPADVQETKDKAAFVEFVERNENCLLRENLPGHITVSAWIVNSKRDKVLFCYHNIYDSWSWVGGHADGEEDLLSVAIREAKEETGADVTPVSENIFSLEILPVSGHMKKGEYVSSHIHYNVTFLVQADENEELFINREENSDVAWIKMKDIPEKSSEKWMIDNVYRKLIERS